MWMLKSCLQQDHRLRHAPSHSLGPDVNMALGSSAGHPGLHGPGGRMTQGDQCSFRCQPRPEASALPWAVTGVTDIYVDSGCNRATDPDITFVSSLGLDDIIATGAQVNQVAITLGVAIPWTPAWPKVVVALKVGILVAFGGN